MKPYILHIETSTKTCSVALSEGAQCIAHAADYEGDHTRVLNSLIREVLAQANLKLNQMSAIAVNEGPGSYTALRIGVVTAKGISYALDKPLIMVPGLKILVSAALQKFPDFEYYLSMIDARRDEVYLSIYNNTLQEIRPAESVILNNDLVSILNISDKGVVMVGNGTTKWNQFIQNWQPIAVDVDILATNMIPLSLAMFEASELTDPGLAKPFYLKLPNITTPKEKLITP